MEPKDAIDIIKRMFKGAPTGEQLVALDMAYDALEKQQPVSRVIIEGKYFCQKCKNLMKYPGYCDCGQRVY